MNIREKLQVILSLAGLTQQELANRLDVTFAALNRWINEKAVPRPNAQKRIDELYKEYSGEKQISETLLAAKKNLVLKIAGTHKNILKEILDNPDILDRFYLTLTYNSNRIEGSTLSENETAAILFQNAAIPNKTFAEQLEAKNHQTALQYLFGHLTKKNPVDEELILKLHGILMNGVRSDAGLYRNHGVRIVGAFVPTANFIKIPELMASLVKDIQKDTPDNIFQISDIHSRFEKIHPFGDGNGRIGRLLMHAMALQQSLPPVVVLQEKKPQYLSCLNKAQLKEDLSLLEEFVCDAIQEGYRIIERR